MMSRPVFLGKLMLYWCHRCNVPVLDERCSRCSSETTQVSVTPPGDIRPAFEYDISLINEIAMEQFNSPLIPDDRLVVLNKAPYDDRMEEIVVDGEVIASIRFEIETLRWTILLRQKGAGMIFQNKDVHHLKNWVMIDDSAVPFICNGASVLAPGIIDCDRNIQKNEEVVVVTRDQRVVAAGRTRMSGDEMIESDHGVGVKTRWNGNITDPLKSEGGQSWDDAIKANREALEKAVHDAHRFIRNVSSTTSSKPVCVSYSGGKDSLAVMQLAIECMDDFSIIFADTGLEFPETIENVHRVVEHYGKELIITSAGDAFWNAVTDFGPPSVESRWCCKVCKLGPISRLIEDNFTDGCLTFLGQRKYESTSRARSERVWKNPWVVNQIGAAPIQNWTALHVWLYIFSTDAPYNPLYEKGYDRIGCWLCPSSSLSELIRLKETHPEMEKRLMKHLHEYAQSRGLSPEWVEHGMWRWQRPPKNIQRVAEKAGIDLVQKSRNPGELRFHMTSGHQPCRAGGISAEGAFRTAVDIELLENKGMLRACGKDSYIEGAAMVLQAEDSAQVFASGNITVRSSSEEKVKELMHRVKYSVIRALKCHGCGVCVGHCSNRAIRIKENTARITGNCKHCGNCIDVCPLIKFDPENHI